MAADPGWLELAVEQRARVFSDYLVALGEKGLLCMYSKRLQARVEIEPTHKGFADLSRTFVGTCRTFVFYAM
jgi:hypothetical protein